MNRKKIKEEYDMSKCISTLSRMLIEENILAKQKCYIYTQYRVHKQLYNSILNTNRELEKENSALYKKHRTKPNDACDQHETCAQLHNLMEQQSKRELQNGACKNNEDKENVNYNASLFNKQQVIEIDVENTKKNNMQKGQSTDIGLASMNSTNTKSSHIDRTDADVSDDIKDAKEQVNRYADQNVLGNELSNTKIESRIEDMFRLYNKEGVSTDYTDENDKDVLEKIKELKSTLEDKNKKIIELENSVIKYQILNRENNKNEENTNTNEVLDLKARIEYCKIDKDRMNIVFHHNMLEMKIKYEELMEKYNKLSKEYEKTLVTIESLKDSITEKKVQHINKICKLSDKIEVFAEIHKDICSIADVLITNYKSMLSYCRHIIEDNTMWKTRMKRYRLFENKRNTKTGEDFYDEEINNLLVVCDNITSENITANEEVSKQKNKIVKLESEIIELKNEIEFLKTKSSSGNVYEYIEEINKKKDLLNACEMHIKKIVEEKDKLVRLNVGRMKVIDVYKDDIKHQSIRILSLENRYKEIEKCIENTKDEFRKMLEVRPVDNACIPICFLCDTRPKSVAISSCMHTFCKECIDMRIKVRDRKCPTCAVSFNVSDVKKIYL